jgi:Ca-activated chloride channel homolog
MRKSLTHLIYSCLIHFSLLFVFLLPLCKMVAQEEELQDQTYSPRFYLPNSDTTLDALPLKSTSANVTITGVIANVNINQVYTNEGTRAIEAKYVFPASTRAAIYYLHMRVGNRLMIADIVERQEAQQIYDSALAHGNTATLLEQMTPNVFQMNVANILPGDTIEIEMRYTELLVPTESVYEFVFPTVVGPRYTGGEGDEWTEGPYQHEGEDPLYDFNIDVKVNAGMPLGQVTCVSHPAITIHYDSPEEATIIPNEETELKGNKDFILQYRLAGNEIQTGLLAYEGEDENFFLAMLQPPQHPEPDDIPPREYVFIMDVSGSMRGFPLSVSKTLMTDLLQDLRATDRFNILFFAGGNYLFRPASVEATAMNITAAVEAVENQTGGGGTELLSAMERALSLEGTEDYSRIFLILTDGYVTVEKETFELIRENLGEANFFAFGIGSSVNRYIIEGIAHVGLGEPFIATNSSEALEKAELFKTYVEAPVLTNINVEFRNIIPYDVEPLSVPDIFAERPIILYGKYKPFLFGSINIDGLSGSSNYSSSINLSDYKAKDENIALKYLWARKRIQMLSDYSSLSWNSDQETIDEIISLGLKYNLLTEYTSFIVVDSIIRCDTCTAETINQPLPLPEGVSDGALGYGPESMNYRSYSMESSETESAFISRIWPNPIVDQFSLELYIDDKSADLPKALQIIDVSGRIVGYLDISDLGEGFHTLFLNITDEFNAIKTGIYFISLNINSDRRHTQVITIQ